MQQRKNIHYIWGIILAAIFITVLANISLLNRFHKLSQLQNLSAAKEEEYFFILKIAWVGVGMELLMLVVFIFFNYSWKDYLISNKTPPVRRTALIILSNLLLLITFICLDFNIRKYYTKLIVEGSPLSTYLTNFFINYLSILIIALIAPYILLRIQKMRSMELNLIRIEKEKTKAELSVLKEQISPHFFFNTLSTLSTIIRNDNKEAGLELIQDISNTYRYTLTSANADLVTLKEELDFIESYVYLLQKRLGEKLQFEMDSMQAYLDAKIPPMSLQLLIENAIQHNIFTQANPLKIKVYVENNLLCVSNNLLEKKQIESFGLGLRNLSNRFQLLLNKDIIIKRSPSKFLVKLPLA